ncbi:MAG: redoxin domain-containing protein [Acidobacteria bacterium]|nr:redoxin domain-containing protein [Acidobacteriota bacterium]
MKPKSRSRILIGMVMLFLVAAISVAVYLWRQNTRLRERLQAATPRQEEPASEPIRMVREGDELPEFTAPNIDGQEVKVAARGSRQTLLFIYSPSCDRCEASIPGWIKISNKLQQLHSSTQVLALSIADSYTTVQHTRKMKLPFAVVPFPSIELQKRYGVTEVPLTVLVNQQGKVQAVWSKPLDEGEVGDVIEMVCPECIERVGF